MVSFAVQKLLSLIRSHLFIFVFVSIALGERSKEKKIAVIFVKECPAYASSRNLISGFTFKSLIHFEFIFHNSVRECSNFILLCVAVQSSQHHLLKRLSFLYCTFLSCHGLINHKYVGLFLGLLSYSIYLCVYFCISSILF